MGTEATPDPSVAFDDLVARLRRSPRVHGLVLLGSTAHGARTPVSDFDLLVLVDGASVPLFSGTTWAGETLVDLLFISPAELSAAVERSMDSSLSEADARLARWLTTGEVLEDRGGDIASAVTKLAQAPAFKATSSDLRARWDHDCYNLAQNRRYANARDDLYARAFHLRLTYGLVDLMVSYFWARDMLWSGEKAAIREWRANDPAYLDEFDRCLYERDTARRFAAYERLVALTWLPYRTPWSTGELSIVPAQRGQASLADWDKALAIWRDLIE